MSTPKFKALVHFLVHQCQDDPSRLGAIRLNKSLWFTDVVGYQLTGAAVTGERYLKRERGPVPATILATIRELQAEGKLEVREPEHRYDPRKFISLTEPSDNLLSESERQLAQSALNAVCGHTANAISDKTHDNVWDAASEGEEIPLFSTLASPVGTITASVRAWADDVVGGMQGRA